MVIHSIKGAPPAMPIIELVQARTSDLQVDATKIEYRRQWHAFSRLDRLEAALRKVRRQSPLAVGQPMVSN